MRPMRVFGVNSHHCLDVVSMPQDASCVWCDEAITSGDTGFVLDHYRDDKIEDAVYHRDCLLRTIFGSVGHIEGQCSCHGGNMEDPPTMTKREAASAAVEAFQRKQNNGD